MLDVRNLRKNFGDKAVLNNISYQFEEGHIYGIVGSNGAGKTTLFRCLMGLEHFEGEVLSPYGKIRNHVGYLETNPMMMSYITGWEYLKLQCISKEIDTEDFEEQNIFDLPLHQYTDTYSTGMKKKLALMGVVLRKNDMYILDEPFNGVDIHSNIIICDIIQKLRKAGKLVLISSHIFSTLKELCDEIVLIEDGIIAKSSLTSSMDEIEQYMKGKVDLITHKVLRIE